MNEIRILHIGVAPREYVKRRTIEIARGGLFAAGEPRHWVSSLDALARILSEKNMVLLEMIRESQPQSVAELAKLSGRAKSNLSRTLHSMESLGLIELREATRGRKLPTVVYDVVKVDYPLLRGGTKKAA
jgi:predicted transcriptional regulator